MTESLAISADNDGAVSLRPRNSAERKAEPVWSGVQRYFPDALAAIARLSKAGNDKHNPGEPLHWARGKSNDHLECVARHLMTPDIVDPETGETEGVAAGWRLLAAIQLAEEKRLHAAGIMPYSGVAPTVEPVRGPVCTRMAGHHGPCNGLPRAVDLTLGRNCYYTHQGWGTHQVWGK